MISRDQVLEIAERVRLAYPDAWSSVNEPGNEARADFIILVGRELNKLDPKVGCNWKRGEVHNLSHDALYNDGQVVDIVGNSEDDLRRTLIYQDVTAAAPGKLANPFELKLSFENEEPKLPTPNVPTAENPIDKAVRQVDYIYNFVLALQRAK